MLAEKGVLQKDSINTYDNYKYFSEAQYKKLFTELFSKVRLELKFTELAYDTFEGSAKQSNGRMPRLEFTLFDCETGFYEKTCITGEGIDKGDKAGYKAYTGALKYYLANTFMVATGDDPQNARKRSNKIMELSIIKDGNLSEEIVKKLVKFEKQVKKLEEQEKALKEAILKSMEDNGILKLENDLLSITYVGATTRESFDNKNFKKDYEDLYNKYININLVKPSIRIKIK